MKKKTATTLAALAALGIGMIATGFAHSGTFAGSQKFESFEIRTTSIQPDGSLWTNPEADDEPVADCTAVSWPQIPAHCLGMDEPIRMVKL